jgi:sirohydrochlorin cobaltochelatase
MADTTKTIPEFEARLRTLLPAQYQDSYEQVEPIPMASAPLKFAVDGAVAWDQIWGSFCDLAMAGGPPHKGALLEPGSPAGIRAHPARYREVSAEICRGIELVTGLAAELSPYPGWIAIDCTSTGQAGWLARAITMENVSASVNRLTLYVPTGPDYRLEKEIKNVVTVLAKTSHYWLGHTTLEQRRAIQRLLDETAVQQPLIQPVFPRAGSPPPIGPAFFQELAYNIHAATQLHCSDRSQRDWLGLKLDEVAAAIRLMRALIVENVFARREDRVVFAAVNPILDPDGAMLAQRVALACARSGLCNVQF